MITYYVAKLIQNLQQPRWPANDCKRKLIPECPASRFPIILDSECQPIACHGFSSHSSPWYLLLPQAWRIPVKCAVLFPNTHCCTIPSIATSRLHASGVKFEHGAFCRNASVLTRTAPGSLPYIFQTNSKLVVYSCRSSASIKKRALQNCP